MMRSRIPATIVAALALALALTSCASNEGGASDAGGLAGQPAPGQPLPGEPLTEEGSGGSVDGGDPADVDRSVIVTASISLSDADPIEIADEVQALAEASGGRVDRRNDTPASGSGTASAELVLRIPSDELDGAVAGVSELATVVWSSVDRRDVTGTVTDITARIGALDASIDRLLALLGDAASTSDLITIESELTTRQAERDSLAAQQESLADQVEYSTVTVQIGVPGAVGEAGPGDFWGGLALGFASLGAFFSGLLVVVGVLLPWLVLLGLIAAVVWWLTRRRRSTGGPRPPRTGAGGPVPAAHPSQPQTGASTPTPQPRTDLAPAPSAPVAATVVPAAPAAPPRPPLPTARTATIDAPTESTTTEPEPEQATKPEQEPVTKQTPTPTATTGAKPAGKTPAKKRAAPRSTGSTPRPRSTPSTPSTPTTPSAPTTPTKDDE